MVEPASARFADWPRWPLMVAGAAWVGAGVSAWQGVWWPFVALSALGVVAALGGLVLYLGLSRASAAARRTTAGRDAGPPPAPHGAHPRNRRRARRGKAGRL